MIPALGPNGMPGTNRRTQEAIDALGRLEKAANQRIRETNALADLLIRHRPVILQCLQSLVIVDPRRRDAVAELVAQIDRLETARRNVDTITDAVNELNQETLL